MDEAENRGIFTESPRFRVQNLYKNGVILELLALLSLCRMSNLQILLESKIYNA